MTAASTDGCQRATPSTQSPACAARVFAARSSTTTARRTTPLRGRRHAHRTDKGRGRSIPGSGAPGRRGGRPHRGMRARDELTGTELEIRADHVIDATGVWSGRPADRSRPPRAARSSPAGHSYRRPARPDPEPPRHDARIPHASASWSLGRTGGSSARRTSRTMARLSGRRLRSPRSTRYSTRQPDPGCGADPGRRAVRLRRYPAARRGPGRRARLDRQASREHRIRTDANGSSGSAAASSPPTASWPPRPWTRRWARPRPKPGPRSQPSCPSWARPARPIWRRSQRRSRSDPALTGPEPNTWSGGTGPRRRTS